jgi:pimeloyl-ACP methyl ester carboxylesterase
LVYSSTETPKLRSSVTVMLCPELPRSPSHADEIARSFPHLADKIANETGNRVVVGLLRGVVGSGGDFSASGWLEDMSFVIDEEGADTVWLVGFGLAGSLAFCLAKLDPRIKALASLGARASFEDFDAKAFLAQCKASGIISSPTFPEDETLWSKDLASLHPLDGAHSLNGRPALVIHGAEDEDVPSQAARMLLDAATGPVDLRILTGAGAWLRADPRVTATLVGWLARRR